MPELYFLRSSENFIIEDILSFVTKLDNKTLQESSALTKYHDLFGYKEGDIGVYMLLKGEIIGVAWVRLLEDSYAFINKETPELMIGIKPKHRRKGYASLLMQQLMYEVSALYSQMSVSVEPTNTPAIKLYEKLGFLQVEGSQKTDEEIFTMLKVFTTKEKSTVQSEPILPKKYEEQLQKSYF